jgi:hypothetical protein
MEIGGGLYASVQSNGDVVLANFPSEACLENTECEAHTFEYHFSQEQQDNLRIFLNQITPTQLI